MTRAAIILFLLGACQHVPQGANDPFSDGPAHQPYTLQDWWEGR